MNSLIEYSHLNNVLTKSPYVWNKTEPYIIYLFIQSFKPYYILNTRSRFLRSIWVCIDLRKVMSTNNKQSLLFRSTHHYIALIEQLYSCNIDVYLGFNPPWTIGLNLIKLLKVFSDKDKVKISTHTYSISYDYVRLYFDSGRN